MSDHSTIKIEIDKCRIVRKVVDYTLEMLRAKLTEFDWDFSEMTSLNEKANTLSERIIEAIEQLVKEVKITRRTANKWYDDELKQLRITKDHAYALAVLVSSHGNWKKYQKARNKYLALIREKKRNYMERKLIKASGDATQSKHGKF